MSVFLSFFNKFWIIITSCSSIIGGFTFFLDKINKTPEKKSKGRTVVTILFFLIAGTSAIVGNNSIAVPNVKLMSIDNAMQTLRACLVSLHLREKVL